MRKNGMGRLQSDRFHISADAVYCYELCTILNLVNWQRQPVALLFPYVLSQALLLLRGIT